MGKQLARAVLVVLAVTSPGAAASLTCGDGRFALGGGRDSRRASFVIAGDDILYGFICPAVPVFRAALRGRTLVQASWRSCGRGTLPGQILRAHVDRTCWTMTGFTRDSTDVQRGFRAVRVPACGNGVREGAEACDDGNTATGDCCSADCQVETGAGCTVACAADADCACDAYCAKAPGDCAGQGVCVQRVEACKPAGDPVCGCDGHSYASSCEAAHAGVSVASTGACTPPASLGEPRGTSAGHGGTAAAESTPAAR